MSTTDDRRLPKYEELRQKLVTMIRNELSPHQPLPSERELTTIFGVSRITVRAALQALADEGLVYRVHGSGTFVAEPSRMSKSLRLSSFSEDMRDRGLVPAAEVLSAEQVPADARLARDLLVSPGAPIVRLRRLRTADGEPLALETACVAAERAPGLLDEDLSGSLHELLAERGLVSERATQRLRATVLREDEAALLAVPVHSPAMHVSRIGVDRRGVPVESTETIYRGDRYDFKMTITRDRYS
jgi:GntR family transcriptional regulator